MLPQTFSKFSLDKFINLWYYFRVMKDEKYSKIAKIIGSFVKGGEYRPFEGAYYHDTNGSVVATDGRRIFVIHDEEKIENPIYMGRDGELLDKTYPNYQMFFDRKYEITWEGEFDLGALIVEREWIKKKSMNVLFKKRVMRMVGKTEAHEVEENLGMFRSKFLADFLRCYRTYYKNRTKSLKVRMRFTKDGDLLLSPLYIETLDRKMSYILMPMSIARYYSPSTMDEAVIMEVEKSF